MLLRVVEGVLKPCKEEAVSQKMSWVPVSQTEESALLVPPSPHTQLSCKRSVLESGSLEAGERLMLS